MSQYYNNIRGLLLIALAPHTRTRIYTSSSGVYKKKTVLYNRARRYVIRIVFQLSEAANKGVGRSSPTLSLLYIYRQSPRQRSPSTTEEQRPTGYKCFAAAATILFLPSACRRVARRVSDRVRLTLSLSHSNTQGGKSHPLARAVVVRLKETRRLRANYTTTSAAAALAAAATTTVVVAGGRGVVLGGVAC